MLGFLAVAVFLRMPIMIKSLLLCAMALVYVLLIELSHKPLFTCFDVNVKTAVPLDIVSVTVVILFVVAVALHGRQVEWMTRLDFLWQLQVQYLDISLCPLPLYEAKLPGQALLLVRWGFFFKSPWH